MIFQLESKDKQRIPKVQPNLLTSLSYWDKSWSYKYVEGFVNIKGYRFFLIQM